MDTQRARIILSAYRASGRAVHDQIFTEALEQVNKDAELAAWYTEHKKLDNRVVDAVKSVHAPSSLKDTIISGGTKKLAASRPRFNPALLALASILIMAVAVFVPRLISTGTKISLASITDAIRQMESTNTIHLAVKSTDISELRRYLSQQGAPADFALPKGLAEVPSEGTQICLLKGNKVSLICLHLPDNRIVHFLAVNRDRLLDSPSSAKPVLSKTEGMSFAAWSDEHRTYIVAASMEIEELNKFL